MDGRHERCFICNDPTHRAGEDSIYIGVSGIGPWCDSCYQDMVQEVEGDARAEERALAANTPAAPALLALARFGAVVIRTCIGRQEPLTMDDVLECGWKSGICEGSSGRLVTRNVHETIAALLAPDGAGDGACPPCSGTNCGSTDGMHHSVECYLGHEAAPDGADGAGEVADA